MTPEQFAYWLQGFAEISQKAPTEKEWQVIKDHLATVFNKVTPNRQPYPLGPALPNDPTKPDTIQPVIRPWPNTPWTGDPYPNSPITPWTTPNYPRPEIICSTQDTTWKPTDGAYCFTLNSTQESYLNLNKELSKK